MQVDWQDKDMQYYTLLASATIPFWNVKTTASFQLPAPANWLSTEWQPCMCNQFGWDPFCSFCFYCALLTRSAHSSKVAICRHDSRYCVGWGHHFSFVPAPVLSPTLPCGLPCNQLCRLSFLLFILCTLFLLLPRAMWATSAVSLCTSCLSSLKSFRVNFPLSNRIINFLTNCVFFPLF